MNIFKKFVNKYHKPKEVLPFFAINAYALSALNKAGNMEDVYAAYKEEVIADIKDAAIRGKVEKYLVFPSYLTVDHKTKLIEDLKALEFTVPYVSDISMIISWKQN